MSRPKPPVGRRFTSETGRAAAQLPRLPEPTQAVTVRLFRSQVDALRTEYGSVSSRLFRNLIAAHLHNLEHKEDSETE